MNDRMIFFPHKRRTNVRLVAKVTGLLALTAAIFLAGLNVGVGIGAKHAALAENTRSLMTVSFVNTDSGTATDAPARAQPVRIVPARIITE